MPNIRKKGKKLVSAWVPEKLHGQLRKIAQKQNITASDVIDKLLTDYTDHHPLILNDSANSAQNTLPMTPVVVRSYSTPKAKSRNQTKAVRKSI